MSHDQRFKTLIRAFFLEFLQLFFADWLHLIDLSEIEWLEQEVNTDSPDGSRHVLDLVAKVRSREAIPPWHLGKSEPFMMAVLIEIESPNSSRSIRGRIPGYTRHLRGKLRMPVLPITLFLKVGLKGVGKLIYREKIRDLVTEYSESLYEGLPHFDAVQYANGDNWLGVALSSLMRIPRGQVVSLGAETLRRLAVAPLEPGKKFLLAECLQAYLPLNETQSREFKKLLQTKAYSEVRAMNLTHYDEGIIKGRVEGRVEGEVRGLLFALELKFGRVDEVVAARINALSSLDEIQRAQTLLKRAKTTKGFLRELAGG